MKSSGAEAADRVKPPGVAGVPAWWLLPALGAVVLPAVALLVTLAEAWGEGTLHAINRTAVVTSAKERAFGGLVYGILMGAWTWWKWTPAYGAAEKSAAPPGEQAASGSSPPPEEKRP